jgi:hypothetical protein
MCALQIWLMILCASCKSTYPYMVDMQTGEKIIGYTKDCKYRIGHMPRISKDSLAKLRVDDSLVLAFSYASLLRPESEVLLGGGGGGRYQLNSGLKEGDSLNLAIKLYGQPVARKLFYWGDNSIKWEYTGLFYPHLAIITRPSESVIFGISVGEQFELDEKYIKDK